jgi:hypothetical protein
MNTRASKAAQAQLRKERRERRVASLSPKELARRKASKREYDRKRRSIERDRARNNEEKVKRLKREIAAKNDRIEALEEKIASDWDELRFEENEPAADEDMLQRANDRYEEARLNKQQFEKLTGETVETFDELYETVKEQLARTNFRGEIRERSAGQRQRLTDQTQLFITLLFLRQYPTYALLSFALGGLPDISLHHYIHRVLRCLDRIDSLKPKWPTDEEAQALLQKSQRIPYPWARKVIAAVDGTEIRVARPSKGAIKNKHYSAKKKQYALNVLLVVLLSGVIVAAIGPLANMNDQSVWNDHQLRGFFVNKPYGIIADGGFTLNYAGPLSKRPPDIIAKTPIKRPRRKKGQKERPKLSDDEKKFNTELSRLRVVVENTNARLKTYKILGSKLRHYHPLKDAERTTGITPALIVTACVGLTNRAIQRNPLRDEDWLPKIVTEDDIQSFYGSDDENDLSEEEKEDE